MIERTKYLGAILCTNVKSCDFDVPGSPQRRILRSFLNLCVSETFFDPPKSWQRSPRLTSRSSQMLGAELWFNDKAEEEGKEKEKKMI